MILSVLKKEYKKLADPERAKNNAWFFKTGEREYGHGDQFIGVTVPQTRAFAKKHKDVSLDVIFKLLESKFHEERLLALIMLVNKFEKADQKEQTTIYTKYLASTQWINNWDLVDTSAHKIVGPYLFDKKDKYKKLSILARSKNMWERRIAILASFYFIHHNEFDDAFAIAEILVNDSEDLIHKAVGWMLREIGKRDLKREEAFLKKHYQTMPRTMLRYAIEKFPEQKRKKYLFGTK